MNSPVDEIKNKLDVVDVIGGYIKLQKAGRNYKASCPFHSEKTPSFMVSPEKQMWHCFGCGKGGSIFDFIMEIEGMEFGDALRMLAQKAGVELKKTDPKLSAKLKTEKSQLYEICDLAASFFIKQLEASKAGKNIQEYLIKRGLRPKTIKDWQVGYAPNQWHALSNFLNSQGYSDDELVKAGLSVKSERKNKYYDRFRDRIIFPICDFNNVVVGFSGRENPVNPDNRMGKYINTPNTLIYDKSRILYGLDKAKLNVRKENLCILVEGQMDILMAHQSGFNNVVASSGTALTELQLKIIKRYTDNLAMAFDMDLAGETATKRGIDLAIQAGFNTKVVSLPDGKDPADCLQKDISVWSKAIKKAQGLMEFYFANAFSKSNPETAEGKKEISKVLLSIIKKIPNKIEQSHWLQELAGRIKVQESILVEEMEKIKYFEIDAVQTETVAQDEKQQNNASAFEEYALGLVLSYPVQFKKCQEKPENLFIDLDLSQIFDVIKKSKDNRVDFKTIKSGLTAHLADKIDYLIFKIEAQKDLNEDFNPQNEIKMCFNRLKKRNLYLKQSQLNLAIQEAENKKDKSALKKLTEEFNRLTKQTIL